MSRTSPPHQPVPIGVLDSGIGGLTIWQEIIRTLPQESTVYIGDHAYLPYGLRSPEEIRERTTLLINFLAAKQAKLIVIACNTATTAGIDVYRALVPHIPIIGVVPVIKTAVTMTRTKHIIVLSTPYTAASAYQSSLIKTFGAGCRIEAVGIPGLAELIESDANEGELDQLLASYLKPEKLRGVDVIVLGCTHYPFLLPRIERMVGNGIRVIDSGAAVARHVARVLSAEHLQQESGIVRALFYTTGDASHVSHVASKRTGLTLQFFHEHL